MKPEAASGAATARPPPPGHRVTGMVYSYRLANCQPVIHEVLRGIAKVCGLQNNTDRQYTIVGISELGYRCGFGVFKAVPLRGTSRSVQQWQVQRYDRWSSHRQEASMTHRVRYVTDAQGTLKLIS